MPCKYWDDHIKISYLQRRIIVWSLMYYELNESCVPDSVYDAVSKQLVHLQSSVDKLEFEKSAYYYAMYDFDGNTGFDIPSRLTADDREHLEKVARIVLDQWRLDTTRQKNKRRRC